MPQVPIGEVCSLPKSRPCGGDRAPSNCARCVARGGAGVAWGMRLQRLCRASIPNDEARRGRQNVGRDDQGFSVIVSVAWTSFLENISQGLPATNVFSSNVFRQEPAPALVLLAVQAHNCDASTERRKSAERNCGVAFRRREEGRLPLAIDDNSSYKWLLQMRFDVLSTCLRGARDAG